MRALLISAAVLAAAAAARADFITGFEPPDYAGAAAGTLLTNGFGGGGQQGWYNPVSGSRDFNVHTYAGNAPGFVNNPNGGDQFASATGVTGFAIGRGQHNNDFSSGGTWTAEWGYW